MTREDDALWAKEGRDLKAWESDWVCEICEESFPEDESDAITLEIKAGRSPGYDPHQKICVECYKYPDPRQDLGDRDR